MSKNDRKDTWASGDAYEPYVGRWSRLVADRFIRWLDIPAGCRWLDVGCGTGALTAAILARAQPTGIVAVDPSPGFIAYAQDHVNDDRVEFRVGDAQALPVVARSVDVTVSGLVLNFIQDMPRAVSEMVCATLPGGRVAAYVWDYAGEMQMMRRFWDAAVALDPSALDKDEGRRFPICGQAPLSGLFGEAGLRHVSTSPIDVPTVFSNFDNYWTPFLGGQGPAPGYCMSLSDDRRIALRERLRATLPVQPDGSIALSARAWAVQGIVPE